jgi:hypothetical protein
VMMSSTAAMTLSCCTRASDADGVRPATAGTLGYGPR